MSTPLRRSVQPPAGYYDATAPAPQPGSRPRPTGSSAAASSSTPRMPAQNLITRLGLQERILDEDAETHIPTAAEKGKGKANASAWSASSDDRELTLRQRKERMVLEARRCAPLILCSIVILQATDASRTVSYSRKTERRQALLPRLHDRYLCISVAAALLCTHQSVEYFTCSILLSYEHSSFC